MQDEKQINGLARSNPVDSNSSTTTRTLVERGIRPVVKDGSSQNGTSTTISAIVTRNKQHEDDQRELQELNTKFGAYLNRVQELENHNGQLSNQLQDLRGKWGKDTTQLYKTYNPELNTLRTDIDNGLRDQILQELLVKRYEYDTWQAQQGIAAFKEDIINRLNAVQQELNASINDLEQIKTHFDRRSAELTQQRANLGNVTNQVDGLQSELVNQRLERVMVENELQTLREEVTFQNALYQVQREEILSLDTPVLDLSKFYRNELAHAIFDIRQDFEVLSQSQVTELEEYYRIKTEQVREQIVQTSERKRLLANGYEGRENTSNSSSIDDARKEYKDVQTKTNQLQVDFDNLVDDLAKIQDENRWGKDKLDQQLNQLREDVVNTEMTLNDALDNNVSLRFELSTYRHLLNSEEQRLDRLEQEESLQSVSSQNQRNGIGKTNHTSQKMSVKKTAKGPIKFDSVDLISDCVLITNEKSTGDGQSLSNWTVRRRNDQQEELVYQFPPSFVLQPGQTVHILSKRSPRTTASEKNVLEADQIETWGVGQVMETRLIDSNNEEKANIKQTRFQSD